MERYASQIRDAKRVWTTVPLLIGLRVPAFAGTCMASKPEVGITCIRRPTGVGRRLQAAGIPATVVPANRIPRPATQLAKTDTKDCIALARYAVPTVEQEATRSIIRRRQTVIRELAKTKVMIKSFLTCHSLPMPNGLKAWNTKSRLELETLAKQPGLRFTLDSLLRQFRQFEEEKKLLERTVTWVQ